MARGAFQERVDYEMAKIVENILDPNCNATTKRKLTVSIELKPDNTRQTVAVNVTAKSSLVPTDPVSTLLYITGDQNGEVTAVEVGANVPGQTSLMHEEEEAPAVLKIVREA